MTMPPIARGVFGVDEEERDKEDVMLSIQCGIHRRGTFNIMSRGLLLMAR
jgi:hypothetical protein